MAKKQQQSISGGTSWVNKSDAYRTDAFKAAKKEATKSQKYHESNADFAKKNDTFKAACEAAGIPATARQASKFRCGRGKAFQNREG